MFHFVLKILAYLAAVILAALVCLVCANVVLRYVFDSPFIWADQITGYGMVYITFLGSPWVLSRQKHIKVEILQDMMGSRKHRLLLGVVLSVIGFVYCTGFGYLASGELIRILERSSQFSDAIVMPQWTVYWTIVAGFSLMAIEFALGALRDAKAYLYERRSAVPIKHSEAE